MFVHLRFDGVPTFSQQQTLTSSSQESTFPGVDQQILAVVQPSTIIHIETEPIFSIPGGVEVSIPSDAEVVFGDFAVWFVAPEIVDPSVETTSFECLEVASFVVSATNTASAFTVGKSFDRGLVGSVVFDQHPSHGGGE